VTIEQSARAGHKRSHQSSIIPIPGADALRNAPLTLAPSAAYTTRTLRPLDVLLLLPIIAPVTAMILFALLGWFVCWLAIVGLLVAAIVLADIFRALMRRLRPAPMQALDPQAVGYQGS
jgi:hypothetical protein